MQNNKSAPKQDEVDLKEVLKIFARRKWWFIASMIIVLISGILYTFLQPVNCLVMYQFNLKETYSNSNLSKFYPGSGPSLNYFTSENAPSIFKSTEIFESLKNLPEKVNYGRLLSSDYVTIDRSAKANVFTVKVSNPDCALANKIALTLINTFDDYVKSKNREALDQIAALINSDIESLEYKNQSLEEEISKYKSDIDSLYSQLYDYIVDYNLDLASRLKTESQGSYSFYNVVIPPNKFEDEISFLKDEIRIYKEKIADNKSELIDLTSLQDNLTRDENIITDRVNLLSEDPVYETDSRRVRNIIVSIVLSIIAGIIVAFAANFFLDLKKKRS